MVSSDTPCPEINSLNRGLFLEIVEYAIYPILPYFIVLYRHFLQYIPPTLSSLNLQPCPRQLRFPLHIRLSRLLSIQIRHPPRTRHQPIAPGQLRRQEHPARRIANGADLVADTDGSAGAHARIEGRIGQQVPEVLRDGVRVAHVDEEARVAVLHLQRDPAGARGDYRLALVDRFRHLDLEALARGELQHEARAGEHCVERLVAGPDAQDDDVRADRVVAREVELRHGGVVDAGCVWVVDGAVAAAARCQRREREIERYIYREREREDLHEELRGVCLRELLLEAGAEFAVGLDDVGDALAGVEARDLADVVARGVQQRVHMDVCAAVSEGMVVISQVPVAEGFVQAVEPTCGQSVSQRALGKGRAANSPVRTGRHQPDHGHRDLTGHKLVDRMADKDVRQPDAIPEVLPDLLLRTAADPDEVAADLDVAAVDDLDLGTLLPDQRDQPGHLRVVDHHDVRAVRRQRTPLAEPVALRIVDHPVRHLRLAVRVQALGGVGDALQDVVVGLCDSEDLGVRFWDVPGRGSAGGGYKI